MAITWDELTAIEPRLVDLLKQAQAVDGSPKHFCANNVWYGMTTKYPNFREEIYRLVGWESKHGDPRIRTSEAFDEAYRTVYEALPPCKDCICL